MKRKCLAVGIILLFVGTGIIPAIAQNIEKPLSVPRGTWLYVGGSGPGNYTKIQDAIDNASDGDTVFVYEGVYHEIITLDKAVTLRGENKETTHLDGTYNNGYLVFIDSPSVTIQNFSLENCSESSQWVLAQAIWIRSHTPRIENINIIDCIFTNNDKSIYFENVTNISIMNCNIHHNRGQSIWGFNSTDITTSDCVINNNGKTQGDWVFPGGITIEPGSNDSNFNVNIVIRNCDIYSNKGWGISINSAENVAIHNNSIRSSTWYGIFFSGITYLRILDNVISGNTWWGISGFSFSLHPLSDVVIQRNNISRNGNGQEWNYGGIYLQNCPDIHIFDNSFYKNNNNGITLMSCPNTSIVNNSITDNKQGICTEVSSELTISHNVLSDNLDAGINLRNSPSTIINNNSISGSTKGIHLGVGAYGVVVINNIITDDAIGISTDFSERHNISSNTFTNISERTLFLNNSYDNIIYHNNFINYGLDPYIYRFAGSINHWIGNYWDRPRLLPKILVGLHIYIILKKIHLKLLAIEIDWHPAQEPYDI